MKTIDYTDDQGFPRRAQVPDGLTEDEAAFGIPLSVDWEALPFDHPFAKRLAQELARRGMLTRQDFYKPNAVQHIQAALMQVLKVDAQTIHRLLTSEGSQENEPGTNSGNGREAAERTGSTTAGSAESSNYRDYLS